MVQIQKVGEQAKRVDEQILALKVKHRKLEEKIGELRLKRERIQGAAKTRLVEQRGWAVYQCDRNSSEGHRLKTFMQDEGVPTHCVSEWGSHPKCGGKMVFVGYVKEAKYPWQVGR